MNRWILMCICMLILVPVVTADWEVTISATNQLEPITIGYSTTPSNEYASQPVMGKVIMWLDGLYSREIKASDLTWEFTVSVPDGMDTTLTWDASLVPGSLSMTRTGSVIDMKSQSTLTQGSGAYTYTITASESPTPTVTTLPTTVPTTSPPGPDFNLELYPGWNMISFPEPLQTGKNTAVYLNAYVNPSSHSMWRYNAETDKYEQMLADSLLIPLDGYWLYSAGVATVPLYFDTGSLTADKQLYTGWNMIGCAGIASTTADIMLSSIFGSWDYIFGFDGVAQRYQNQIIPPGTGAIMTPGQGYWLYVHENCILTS